MCQSLPEKDGSFWLKLHLDHGRTHSQIWGKVCADQLQHRSEFFPTLVWENFGLPPKATYKEYLSWFSEWCLLLAEAEKSGAPALDRSVKLHWVRQIRDHPSFSKELDKIFEKEAN